MNRRELLGAMAALFCGVILPKPVRETIRVASDAEVLAFGKWKPVRLPVETWYDPEFLDFLQKQVNGAWRGLLNKMADERLNGTSPLQSRGLLSS